MTFNQHIFYLQMSQKSERPKILQINSRPEVYVCRVVRSERPTHLPRRGHGSKSLPMVDVGIEWGGRQAILCLTTAPRCQLTDGVDGILP